MKVKIALIQMSMTANLEDNLKKALANISTAAKLGANIVCLPELFTSPYFPNQQKAKADHYLEQVPGKTTETLAKAARDLGVVVVGGSIYEKDGSKKYNTSFVIDADGKLLGKYRKVHIPHDPSFYEQNYFEKGNLGFQVFETKYGKIAPLICYDQWFPEAARTVALMGAQIIFYPTAIGTVDGVEQSEGNWQEAWRAVQRGHAIANACVVATVNRVGKEGSSNFWGGSFIYSQFGTLLIHGSNDEEFVMAEVDLSLSDEVKKGWRFFEERRPDVYKI